MKRFSSILTLTTGLILIGAGCGLTTTVKVPAVNTNVHTTNTQTVNTNTAQSGSISYAGQDGKNALELLQRNHTVDVTAQGFVNVIDGRKLSDRQFWAFYVNDKQADVGAKDYQTKNNDTLEWKIEKF